MSPTLRDLAPPKSVIRAHQEEYNDTRVGYPVWSGKRYRNGAAANEGTRIRVGPEEQWLPTILSNLP